MVLGITPNTKFVYSLKSLNSDGVQGFFCLLIKCADKGIIYLYYYVILDNEGEIHDESNLAKGYGGHFFTQ